MFKKVLVVEDLDTVGYGISMMIQNKLGIHEVTLTKYCDEAYLKFQKEQLNTEPFDLLITDLSFPKDYRPTQIHSGGELVEKIRRVHPTVPIIIFSIEEKVASVQHYLNVNKVSAYVLKGRNGLKDLEEAIQSIKKGKTYLSEKMEQLTNGHKECEINDYDITLLRHLSKGLSQNQISQYYKVKGVSPNSLSSIEKKLNRLKDLLKASNNVQLVSNAKDLGII